jgi:hypothetical protein
MEGNNKSGQLSGPQGNGTGFKKVQNGFGKGRKIDAVPEQVHRL